MAVTDAYSTAATYRSVIDKTDTGEDAEILVDLTAVSRWLDRELGRFFTVDAGDIARDFRSPLSADTLYIDDLSVAPASVLVDDDDNGTPTLSYAVADYVLDPVNAAKGAEPAPYTSLRVPGWSAKSPWIKGRLVRVTGRWGWPAIPSAIARGCIHLTALLRMETPRAQAQISELGQLITMSPQSRLIVDRLMAQYSKRAVLV